jgi:tetratricopeptide (TPR) repeat protein
LPLPPENVPPNLSLAEYERLNLLYGLMQRVDKVMEVVKFMADAKAKEDAKAGLLAPLSEAQSEAQKKQFDLGQRFAMQFMQLLTQPPAQNAALSPEQRQTKLVEQLMDGMDEADLAAAGIAKPQIEEMVRKIGELLESADPPPREVPTGLSAQEYYDLGIRYKTAGWTEQSRDALNYSFELEPNGEIGKLAQRYLRTKLPRHPVPMIAVQRNVDAFNEMVSNQTEAAKLSFGKLIQDYPDFEWPYSNLGSLYITEGNLDSAKEALGQALAINEYYINARLHLCRAQILDSEFQAARKNLKQVVEIDPDENVEALSATLEKLASTED